METIADRIRRLLKVRGMSQSELAVASGMNRTQLSTILAALDKDPGAIQVSTLTKLATGGRCSYAWLATGIEDATVEAALRAPQLRTLPAWPALLADAKSAEPLMPEWVWQRVAEAAPLGAGAVPTVAEVTSLARHVRDHGARPAASERVKTGPQPSAAARPDDKL